MSLNSALDIVDEGAVVERGGGDLGSVPGIRPEAAAELEAAAGLGDLGSNNGGTGRVLMVVGAAEGMGTGRLGIGGISWTEEAGAG